MSAAERALVIVRFPQYQRRVLACRDGRVKLVEDDRGPVLDLATRLWVVSYDAGAAVWSIVNLAASDVRICSNSALSSVIIEPELAWTKEGLAVNGGSDVLRLDIHAGIAKLLLELKINEACVGTASFECVKCGQIRPGIFLPYCPCTSRNLSPGSNVLDRTDFDYVVVGTSFCAYAFVHQTIKINPNMRILLLERGEEFLPKHRQAYPEQEINPGELETTLWSSSPDMIENYTVKGQLLFYGGRSTFWSGWCPKPSEDELDGWPEKLKRPLLQLYLDRARTLLGVTPVHNIQNTSHRVYDPAFQEFLENRSGAKSGLHVSPGHLAMANEYEKFSTPGPLKGLVCDNIQTVQCTVEKIVHDGKKATHLKTSRGYIPLGNAKLILAMSTLPSTTLVLNSFNKVEFPRLANVGERFTAHCVSSVVARAPRSALPVLPSDQGIQLGAVYIVGKQQAQFHLQLSAAATCKPDSDDLDSCQRYSANSISPDRINDSPEHVLISCSALGELDHKNQDNWFRLKDVHHSDLTCNCELQIIPNKQDLNLWNSMEDEMFEVIENNLSSTQDKVEYWHEGVWKTEHPKRDCIRKLDMVHDASTMWVGDDEDTEAPVGLDYRLRGVDNVYITGGALWPTGGSWNPVLTIVAMAMHLADSVNRSSNVGSVSDSAAMSSVPSKL